MIAALPKLIRVLAVVGTLAMLLVGGGIFIHNLESLHHALEFMPVLLGELLLGLALGTVTLLGVHIAKRLFQRRK